MPSAKILNSTKKKELFFFKELHLVFLSLGSLFSKGEQRKRWEYMCQSDLNVSICNTALTDVYI